MEDGFNSATEAERHAPSPVPSEALDFELVSLNEELVAVNRC